MFDISPVGVPHTPRYLHAVEGAKKVTSCPMYTNVSSIWRHVKRTSYKLSNREMVSMKRYMCVSSFRVGVCYDVCGGMLCVIYIYIY